MFMVEIVTTIFLNNWDLIGFLIILSKRSLLQQVTFKSSKVLWITVRLVFHIRVTSLLQVRWDEVLLKVPPTPSQTLIKVLQTALQMNEQRHPTAAPWWQVPKVNCHQKRKVIKDQMPATMWNQRQRHTARHLLPFRGNCRESFIMDVMESWPRSESNHHPDTSPSGQRHSVLTTTGERGQRQCHRPCLHP